MDTIAVAPSSAQIMQVEPDVIAVLSVERFIEKCLRFNDSHPDFPFPTIERGVDCPVHVFAEEVMQKACKRAVSGIRTCPVCHRPMCPACGNHSVTQISRVTGYIGEVGGWNESKKQELKDRQRYQVGVGGRASNVER